jgi:hypothetical protein
MVEISPPDAEAVVLDLDQPILSQWVASGRHGKARRNETVGLNRATARTCLRRSGRSKLCSAARCSPIRADEHEWLSSGDQPGEC